jgi:tRNA-Thr(GGU) m(6)t(6)A37 methyltransferase TsaA
MDIVMKPIGVARTPFKERKEMPIQPAGAKDVVGEIEVDEEFLPGLKDLDGFSHVFIIYCFHESKGYDLMVVPFMDTVPRGVFATRAPRRPNPVGLSVVRVLGVKGRRVLVQGIDVLDGTPVLDIKPYVPKFDSPEVDAIGWLQGNDGKSETLRSDGRFVEE